MPAMHSRKLGQTGVELSEVALGTWGLMGAYGRVDPSVSRATIETALDVGVSTFDTAPLWGDGAAETILGELLADRDAQVVTRGGCAWEGDHVRHRFDIEALRSDCERSLDRLQRERIDVWLLHEPPENVLDQGDAYNLCTDLKDEGKIAAWGISTSKLALARKAMANGAHAVCMPHNLLQSADVHDLEDEAAAAGVGILARSPLLHGLLAGRWTEYRQFGDADHRRARWTQKALATRIRQVNALRYLVHDDVKSMASAAIRFVLASRGVTTCILGARRPLQIRNAAAMAGEPPYLPDDDMRRIRKVLAEG